MLLSLSRFPALNFFHAPRTCHSSKRLTIWLFQSHCIDLLLSLPDSSNTSGTPKPYRGFSFTHSSLVGSAPLADHEMCRPHFFLIYIHSQIRFRNFSLLETFLLVQSFILSPDAIVTIATKTWSSPLNAPMLTPHRNVLAHALYRPELETHALI